MPEPSLNQEKYLQSLKRHKQFVTTARLLLLVVFFVLWEIAVRLQWIDGFIFSSPTRIVSTFISMLADHSIFVHIGTTLTETLVSFILVVFLGITISVILWLSPKLSQILEPYLVVLNSLPKSALAPLLIVWLGANIKTIIIAGISVAIFGTIINLYTEFQEVSHEKIKLIYTLRGTKKDVLLKVILPSTVPVIISIMKVNIGLCLVGVIIGAGVK